MVPSPGMPSPAVAKTLLIYAFMLAAAIAAFLGIHRIGVERFPFDAAALPDEIPHINHLLHVLLAIASVIVAARIMGRIFRKLGQPAVIGEVVAGLMLGPSVLGRIAPDALAYLLPPATAPFISVIAQLGVILYMFLIGLELDLKILKKSGHSALAISHASIVLPFLLGAAFALSIYSSLAPSNVPFLVFSLFLGVSLSITALPVLARILAEKNMTKTRLGELSLTCAAIDDVSAWCLLALVISLTHATLTSAVSTLLLTIAYIAFMFLGVRPLVRRLHKRFELMSQLADGEIAVIFVAILLSALTTEYIGIHAIFGAFLFGAILPHEGKLTSDLTHRIDGLVLILFLPVFFAFTGMRTQIGLLDSGEDWATCGIIILLAVLGKLGGSAVAARFTGINWRDSLGLGILMNTRGLVELIVLNIGLDLKIITPRLFTMLVIMAVVTTMMTSPLLDIVIGNKAGRTPQKA